MSELLKSVQTRFRAYQIGSAGSSFSYFANNKFTLIEARLTDASKASILSEMRVSGRTSIDTLHITSWDQDHCSEADLALILTAFTPGKIEYPGYPPHTDTAKACLASIRAFHAQRRARSIPAVLQAINPDYIASLDHATGLGYNDVFYHPRVFYEGSNNNSTVKVFRSGSFNVASLGDIEHPNLGAYLRGNRIFKSEVDVLILAHHGADNGVTTKKFLEEVSPTVAVCSSNHGNQFEHPRPEIRQRLSDLRIQMFTTKHGDIVIESVEPHRGRCRVTNLISDSTRTDGIYDFQSKKTRLLGMNADSVRNRYHPGVRGPR